MKHLLTVTDLTPQEIQEILDLSTKMQENPTKFSQELSLKNILFAFEKPSLRTKIGTEVAINHLGGNVLHIDPENFLNGAQCFSENEELLAKQKNIREALKDTVQNVNQWCNAIFSRVFKHETLQALAKYSTIPIVNALCDKHHPMQALCDLLTIQQNFGKDKKIKTSFVGDANNVAFSLFEILLSLGHEVSFGGPEEYFFSIENQQHLQNLAKKYNGKITFTTNAKEAVKNADVIYADTFISMGEEHIYDEKIKAFAGYQVNNSLMTATGKSTTKFMHCLPAHRGEEVTDEVIDSKNSIIYQQAKNRMVVSKGVFSFLINQNQ